jgi:hypothetical protein
MQPTPNEIENRSSDRREADASANCIQSVAADMPSETTHLNPSADGIVILDDVVSSSTSVLADNDLRLIKALQAVLEARRIDNSVKNMRAQISDELEWV